MNRYDILLNKLPIGDLSVRRDRRTGEVYEANTERILVLGFTDESPFLLRDALDISKQDNCRHIEFISSMPFHGIEGDLANNPSFFRNSWRSFQSRGLRSTATALYLDNIGDYKDIDDSSLSIKDILHWATTMTKVSRIVASCYLNEFTEEFHYEVIPDKFVIDKTSWTIKVLA
jgi:hypothetical protein